MRVFFLTSLLTAGVVGLGFTSCAPQTQAVAGITVTPVLFKLSSAGVRGQNVTVQGRYLGGPSTARVVLGADSGGAGGYVLPANAIVSWTDSQIVFTVPANAPVGGSWLFVQVGDMRSTGLPFSVVQ
ncbi:IPT/TIG domain-containing protein [Deinococcus aquiradiocola]|uniref:Cell surface protein n=1 Tax=Deinococcus aquiradiocola TaxID=393059 RepID=A0A917P5Y1_9DEIO|nr:IPT/TIG domain-containing protein [Deinococcus aquiradiocola]GGJ63204.1 cell surface protein [Deinococcus aquiradiocola]